MYVTLRFLLLLMAVGAFVSNASGQSICPTRPSPGSPVLNPLDLYSQNGVLTVDLLLQNQKQNDGFMHYCYIYMYQGQQVEAQLCALIPATS